MDNMVSVFAGKYIHSIKKVVFLYLLLPSFECFSQSFVNPNAEWNFETDVSALGYTQYTQWKYLNDTLIGTKTYQKVGRKLINIYTNSSFFSYTSTTYLFRNQGDSVYVSKNNGIDEYLLYDFTPVIGNSWDVLPLLNGSISSPTTPQFVQTIGWGDTLINGNSINWIEIISLNPDSLYFSGKIFNHFGRRQLLPSWDDGSLDPDLFLWKCYKDDIIGNITYTNCVDFETLNLDDLNNCQIKIISDQNNKCLFIDNYNCISKISIAIYDLMGRNICIFNDMFSNKVNLNIPNGLYICYIFNDKMKISKKFLW
jgi:hypothetical protein